MIEKTRYRCYSVDEGYLSYPYRPSIKNRQRWMFEGLYPPRYAAAQAGSDASAMQTQCLVRGDPRTRLSVKARFLQLVARQVGEFERPLDVWPDDELPLWHGVESLRVGDDRVHSWQEAVEQEITLGAVDLGDLVSRPRWSEFSFRPCGESEPLRDPSGTIIGLLVRERRRIQGTADLAAEVVGNGVFRVTVRLENRTPLDDAKVTDRDEALLHSLVSTHTILGVERGMFISLLDPPEPLRGLAAGCCNVGTWPVLVGAAGEADTILSSPIILYDDPHVAPESPGDLFDATEIDEILTLRILTMTDEEKRSMATLDDRGRALLERTEALARDQLLKLHGTMRDLHPLAKGPNHG